MKRNLALLTLLSFLLITTYYLYEKPTIESVSKDDSKSLMDFKDLGELKGFRNNNISITIQNDRYFIGDPKNNYLAEKKNIELFLNYLGNLHHKKIITSGKREEFIPINANQLVFNFDKESLIFTLGKKLDFSPEYYLELKRKNQNLIVLVEDKNIPDGVYQKEDSHNHDLNYRQILTLMNLDAKFFEDKKVFRIFNDFKIEYVDLTNFRGNSYKINLDKNTTNPMIPDVLKINTKAVFNLREELEKLKSKKLIRNFDKKQLEQKLAEIKITLKSSKEVTLSLYNKYKNTPGYFLQNSHDSFLFEMQRSDCEFLFRRIDHYWDLHFSFKLDQSIFINGISYPLTNNQVIKITNLLKSRARLWKEVDLKKEKYQYLYQVKTENNLIYKFYHREQEVFITMDDKSGLLYYVGKDFPVKIGN